MQKPHSVPPAGHTVIVIEPSDKISSVNDTNNDEDKLLCYSDSLPFGPWGNIVYIICNFGFIVLASWAFYLLSIEPWRLSTNTNEGNTDFNVMNVSIGFCVFVVVSIILLSIGFCLKNIYMSFIKTYNTR